MSVPLYNAEILRLATAIPFEARLPEPHATVTRQSPICGSRVIADVRLDDSGRVAAFGQEVRACALGQASASILGAGVIGQDASMLRAAHDALAGWLRQGDALPDALAGSFPAVALFEPARRHPARHASILLAFDAAATAAEQAAPDPDAAAPQGAPTPEPAA